MLPFNCQPKNFLFEVVVAFVATVTLAPPAYTFVSVGTVALSPSVPGLYVTLRSPLYSHLPITLVFLTIASSAWNTSVVKLPLPSATYHPANV